MASTTFTDNTTVIVASWLNEVDAVVWDIFGGATTAAGARTALGLGTTDSPQFTAIEVGNASDTTLARESAGDVSVEGNIVYRAGGTDVPVTDGGTGASTASAARTNLGLGALATKNTVNNGDWSGTDLAVTNGGTGASDAATARTNLDVYSTSEITTLHASRNMIINGDGRINQRSYVSATVTTSANEYTLDRWRVVTSGQSLSFTGTNKKTMTAPAGGVEQVIEGNSLETGTYTISFTGTATCTVDAVSKTSGDTFSATEGTNVTVKFTSGTFTDVQVEKGSVATSFEQRAIGTELVLCQRYYESSYPIGSAPGTAITAGACSNIAHSTNQTTGFRFSTRKRTTPTVTIYSTSGVEALVTPLGGGTDVGTSVTADGSGETGVLRVTDSGSGFTATSGYRLHYTADAEI